MRCRGCSVQVSNIGEDHMNKVNVPIGNWVAVRRHSGIEVGILVSTQDVLFFKGETPCVSFIGYEGIVADLGPVTVPDHPPQQEQFMNCPEVRSIEKSGDVLNAQLMVQRTWVEFYKVRITSGIYKNWQVTNGFAGKELWLKELELLQGEFDSMERHIRIMEEISDLHVGR